MFNALTQQADTIEKPPIEKKLFKKMGAPESLKKSFPLKEWGRHFSPLGSKRASIQTGDPQKKKIFKPEILENKKLRLEISAWDKKMKSLYKTAKIKMDDQAELVADHQLYSMLLQDPKLFSEIGDGVSLRDLNRYQFRRNRNAEGIPVKRPTSKLLK